jgi:hypothetical protein
LLPLPSSLFLFLSFQSRAVAGRGADGGRKLDGLKRSIKEARLKQISEESELYENQAKSLNSKFDEYINVFSIKLNSNLKAQDAWERYLAQTHENTMRRHIG